MAKPTKPTKPIKYIRDFFAEKDIDPEQGFEVEGPSGTNHMPYGVVIEAIKGAPVTEQKAIASKLRVLDYHNSDIRPFLRHLGQALAQ